MENSSLYWDKTFSAAYNVKLGELLEEEQLLKLFSKQMGQSQGNIERQINQDDTKIRFLDAKLARNLGMPSLGIIYANFSLCKFL